MSKKWFEETLHEEHLGYKQAVIKHTELAKKTSKFQDIEVFSNPKFGKVLALDGVLQTTEADEFFYHEMFVHVPLFSHGKVKKVLVIGGGDGGIIREILRHKSVEKVVMVEIDGEVIDLCKLHMPSLNNGAFEDKRATIKVADGIEFVKNTNEKFDVIIVDSTDPMNAGEVLFTDEFYANAKKCLAKDGIITTQSGVPFFQKEELQNVYNKLSKIFLKTTFYVVPVPTYAGSFMCLSFATDYNFENTKDAIIKRIVDSKIGKCKYYNADMHLASFALPEYIKDIFL